MLSPIVRAVQAQVNFQFRRMVVYTGEQILQKRLDSSSFQPLRLSNFSSRKVNYILKMSERVLVQDKICKALEISQPMCITDFKNFESSSKSIQRALRSLARIGYIKRVFKAHGANYYALYNWSGISEFETHSKTKRT